MGKPVYQPIKQTKVSTLIVDQIKDHIVHGELSPGDPLPSERELMKSFSVSRSSLREALKILDAMGFVTIEQRKRTRVRSLVPESFVEPIHTLLKEDMETVVEVIEVRKCMETWNAYYAAERATDVEIQRLERNVESMNSNIKQKKTLIKDDASFHLIISEMTHNKIQSHLMSSIYEMIQNSVGICYEENDTAQIFDEHRNIFLAIKQKDSKLAQIQMGHHLNSVQTRIHNFFAKKTK